MLLEKFKKINKIYKNSYIENFEGDESERDEKKRTGSEEDEKKEDESEGDEVRKEEEIEDESELNQHLKKNLLYYILISPDIVWMQIIASFSFLTIKL